MHERPQRKHRAAHHQPIKHKLQQALAKQVQASRGHEGRRSSAEEDLVALLPIYTAVPGVAEHPAYAHEHVTEHTRHDRVVRRHLPAVDRYIDQERDEDDTAHPNEANQEPGHQPD
eukprot:CAMPEP_0182491150 /NCGR_PEP_ID=MMETSP1321-20130603/727_1 /TAXON_ID=91990 /ORGANISM="Bolidomonas sp., Strain RCC1657" /LENGTH=115 /DNA_ID=CAMNT_0024693409 /DNA_START=616 /DNA_END=963 /DNA_ORIENTATION=+